MPKEPSRRLALFDGSQMGDHYLVAALLCGKINYPVLVQPCKGRGHELKSTQQWLPLLHQRLGPAAPQLWLFDALYFNRSTFTTVRNLDAHLLIKHSPDADDAEGKLFRDVLEDAKALFAVDSPAIDPVEKSNGFDSARWCSWSMKKTSAEFAGFPVNIPLPPRGLSQKEEKRSRRNMDRDHRSHPRLLGGAGSSSSALAMPHPA
jgi:hypothetical protein